MDFEVRVLHYARKPCGVVVKVHDMRDGLGFSLCNPIDKFDLGMGVKIAYGRALKLNNGHRMSVWDKVDYYVAKAQRKGNRVLAEKLMNHVFPELQRIGVPEVA